MRRSHKTKKDIKNDIQGALPAHLASSPSPDRPTADRPVERAAPGEFLTGGVLSCSVRFVNAAPNENTRWRMATLGRQARC